MPPSLCAIISPNSSSHKVDTQKLLCDVTDSAAVNVACLAHIEYYGSLRAILTQQCRQNYMGAESAVEFMGFLDHSE